MGVGIVSKAYFLNAAPHRDKRGGSRTAVNAHVKPVDRLTPARKADTVGC
jgi:hypothetical protein